ncbi:hypothetical protein [Sorangium sp. So ce1024]|jgi:hypothetical protein|uniref:hypothetical protein n=1 Tax=unclassified Sorangium TaxID=2621164 RepID=UPI003EFDDA41
MSGGLIFHDDGGGPVARCTRCGAEAAGPCARCRAPVCGDCCVLTEGGARIWAICLACEDRGGRSLRRGWATVLGWIALPIAALAAVVALLEWLHRR